MTLRKHFFVWGVIAPLPMGLLTAALAMLAIFLGGPDKGPAMLPLVLGVVPSALAALWFTAVALYCFYDILAGGRIPERQKLAWVAGWLILNAPVVAAWVYLYEWKDQGGSSG